MQYSDVAAIARCFRFVSQLDGSWRAKDGEIKLFLPIQSTNKNLTINLREESSDVQVFDEVFRRGEYKRFIEQIKKAFGDEAITIVDAGANIGCTTLLLARHFPNARIISIEPNSNNLSQLKKNVIQNGLQTQVCICPYGLWVYDTILYPENDFRDCASWSFALSEQRSKVSEGITCKSLSSIMQECGAQTINVLKMDIEGSEKGFLENPSCINKVLEDVKVLAIEIHEEAISLERAVRTLHHLGFICMCTGDRNTICAVRENLESDPTR